MDFRDKFRRACAAYEELTERFEIEEVPDSPALPLWTRVSDNANDLINKAREVYPQLPHIHFDFFLDPTINACAFSFDGTYFIGMNWGIPGILNIVTQRLMGDPQVLRNIGNPDVENPNLPKAEYDKLNAEQLFQAGLHAISARDEERRQYGIFLMEQAVQVVVGHELAHITRGHLSLCDQGLRRELGNSGSKDENLTIQAIEFDADRRTVFSRCHSVHMSCKLAEDQKKKLPIDIEQRLHFGWAFGTNVFMRLFGNGAFSESDFEQSDHPPWPVRRIMAIRYAKRVLGDHMPESEALECIKAIDDAFEAAEKALECIGIKPNRDGFHSAMSAWAESKIREIDDRFLKLIPQLQPYSVEQLP